VIKSRRWRGSRQVALMKDMRNSYGVLLDKLEGKIFLLEGLGVVRRMIQSRV
jgi:hypothetical protein